MGSSCFARGNKKNAGLLQKGLKDFGLEHGVELSGCLCMGLCKHGPNVKVGEDIFHGVNNLGDVEEIIRKIKE